MGVSRRARSKWARSQLLGALLEALLACLEDLECQEDPDQECQEANTTRDVFASTCPATCPRCHQQDLDQDIQALDLEALDLDLVPHLFLPLVAMEQVTAPVVLPRGRPGLLEARRSRSTSGHGRPVWSGLVAPLSSVEQQSSAMSGF